MTIEERWTELRGRPSGFDYLRIVLAGAVVLWHSYELAYGWDETTRLWVGSPWGYVMRLVLPMFFALSGFLVAGSMYRNPNLRAFLTLRAIRIFPALVMEVTLSALVLGPLMTTWTLQRYFTDTQFKIYFLNMAGYIHYQLPGVFLQNPTPRVVNAQLWTVPYELECYLLIMVIFLLGFFKIRARVLPFFVVATIVVAVWLKLSHVPPAPTDMAVSGRLLVLCFLAGVIIYAFRERLALRLDLAIGALIAATLLPVIGHGGAYLMPLPAAYLTVYLGLLNPPRTIVIKSGDYSYGMYLYSWPLQQAVEKIVGYQQSWITNAILSVPITIAFALLSWWCVEKPFLKLRRFVSAEPAPTPARDVDEEHVARQQISQPLQV